MDHCSRTTFLPTCFGFHGPRKRGSLRTSCGGSSGTATAWNGPGAYPPPGTAFTAQGARTLSRTSFGLVLYRPASSSCTTVTPDLHLPGTSVRRDTGPEHGRQGRARACTRWSSSGTSRRVEQLGQGCHRSGSVCIELVRGWLSTSRYSSARWPDIEQYPQHCGQADLGALTPGCECHPGTTAHTAQGTAASSPRRPRLRSCEKGDLDRSRTALRRSPNASRKAQRGVLCGPPG
jgi:hypothetical protein